MLFQIDLIWEVNEEMGAERPFLKCYFSFTFYSIKISDEYQTMMIFSRKLFFQFEYKNFTVKVRLWSNIVILDSPLRVLPF